ncbi:MAG: ABC transporter permease [Candidatus Omnitrophica bacterium]|nr:ABC transporter permease [Candidatus Omnitrophota bacterium]MBU1996264.1 ABC transporter permease [Candidatus Omnitrophota bacterium]MBU4334520.1 ABC transporter permease [Candidatus Omnitrophota bacterium]
MDKIFAIVKKELLVYFKSPIAYIVLIITISVFNTFFFTIIDQNKEATLRDVFLVMEFLFMFIIPLLTMKVFSEEKFSGTMEFLMTTPTSNTQIVLGKYIGSLLFFTSIIVFTFIYYLIIEMFGSPDKLAVLTGYLGIWLEGAFFIAIGVLTSSWTRNQIVSAITSYVILFLLYFSMIYVKYLGGMSYDIIHYLSTSTHLKNFAQGSVSVSDVVYYLSGIMLCILLTRVSIENRI